VLCSGRQQVQRAPSGSTRTLTTGCGRSSTGSRETLSFRHTQGSHAHDRVARRRLVADEAADERPHVAFVEPVTLRRLAEAGAHTDAALCAAGAVVAQTLGDGVRKLLGLDPVDPLVVTAVRVEEVHDERPAARARGCATRRRACVDPSARVAKGLSRLASSHHEQLGSTTSRATSMLTGACAVAYANAQMPTDTTKQPPRKYGKKRVLRRSRSAGVDEPSFSVGLDGPVDLSDGPRSPADWEDTPAPPSGVGLGA